MLGWLYLAIWDVAKILGIIIIIINNNNNNNHNGGGGIIARYISGLGFLDAHLFKLYP